jgi:hypothetical protein
VEEDASGRIEFLVNENLSCFFFLNNNNKIACLWDMRKEIKNLRVQESFIEASTINIY